ncbi:MAG: endonuclease [Candidatus Phlomobacter fragariae]
MPRQLGTQGDQDTLLNQWAWIYMLDRYGFVIPLKQQAILMQWDRQYPPDARDRERDRRIAAITGVHNPFVTGEKVWEKH